MRHKWRNNTAGAITQEAGRSCCRRSHSSVYDSVFQFRLRCTYTFNWPHVWCQTFRNVTTSLSRGVCIQTPTSFYSHVHQYYTTFIVIVIIIIFIIIRHELDLNSPVSASFNSLFKGPPRRLRPFGQQFSITVVILLPLQFISLLFLWQPIYVYKQSCCNSLQSADCIKCCGQWPSLECTRKIFKYFK
jgi:hypothetical protein